MTGPFELTLKEFEKKIQGSDTTVKDMLVVLNNRGFGALLLIPCLIEIFPTGAIPGVPSICAIIIILLSMQILLGRKHPWMPKSIRNKTFDHEKIETGLKKTMPYVRWVDRKTKQRWSFLASHHAERLAALSIIVLALAMFPLELLPFASTIPSCIIALYAIGFLTKDGMVLFVAWVLALGGGIGIGYLLNSAII